MVRCTVLVNSGKLAVNTLANAKTLILAFTPAIQSNFFQLNPSCLFASRDIKSVRILAILPKVYLSFAFLAQLNIKY